MNNMLMMAPEQKKSIEPWLSIQLWGLDTPITAICWSVAIAALMQITMITPAPMLLVAGGVWCTVMLQKLYRAITKQDSWQAAFYRGHSPLILVLLFAVGMATLWMLFFYVGKSIISYMIPPLALLSLSGLLSGTKFRQIGTLFKAIAFAMVCAMPAFYFCFTLNPLHMLTTAPVWYLGILFFLMAEEREHLRSGIKNTQSVVVNTLTLIMLLGVTLISGVTAPMFERTLCVTIAIGAGCLQGFSRLAQLISPNLALAFSWLAMALPAVLGIILYAPHSW